MRLGFAILGAAVIVSLLSACQLHPKQQEFTIRNGSDLLISATYGVDNPNVGRQDYLYYSTLALSSVDKNEWCTFCNVQPDMTAPSIFFPFTRSEQAYFAARDSQTNELIFYREFSFDELENMDWIVPIIDQRP